LAVQRLATNSDRALVVSELAGLRNRNGWFSPADLRALFDALRVPAPARIDNELTGLAKRRWLLRRAQRPGWSLTPVGRERVRELLGGVDADAVQAEIAALPGAELGHALHTLLPPSLAPVKWAAPIKLLLDQFPFETNVFGMTRFPAGPRDDEYLDPVAGALEATRDALSAHGLRFHLASDRVLDDDLLGNVAAHMWACQYGIGFFEDRLGRGVNHNLVIEVGAMVMTGRRCALLRDRTVEHMPTDFVGQIYKRVDLDDPDTLGGAVHLWAADDLGLGHCAGCPQT
jgi:hypothetical protein